MIILFFLIIVSVIGIAAVFWLLKNEKNETGADTIQSDQSSNQPEIKSKEIKSSKLNSLIFKLISNFKSKDAPKETEVKPKPQKSLILGIISKIFSRNNKKVKNIQREDDKEILSLRDRLGLNDFNQPELNIEDKHLPDENDQVSTGTVSLKTNSAQPVYNAEQENKITAFKETSKENSDAEQSYERLEKLFNEKTAELENVKLNLKAEIEAHKDFTKVKDILEKELKESRENLKKSEFELKKYKTEQEEYKAKINFLEAKLIKLENDNTKKQEINNKVLNDKNDEKVSPNKKDTGAEIEELLKGNFSMNDTHSDEKPLNIKNNETKSIVGNPENKTTNEGLKLRPDIFKNDTDVKS